MNGKISYQNAGGGGLNSGLPATWAMEAEADSHNFKIALLAALLIHILVLWVAFPSVGSPVDGIERPTKKRPVRILIKAPKEDPLDKPEIIPHKKPVPFPDQTPLEPEPYVAVTPSNVQDMPDFDYDPTPPEIKTVEEGTEGLIRPSYDMAQLQHNVVYPPLGLKAGMQGYVVVQAVLNRDGTVSNVEAVGGTLKGFGFPDAATAAVRKLKFTPGTIYGNPVNVVMNLTIHFRLRR